MEYIYIKLTNLVQHPKDEIYIQLNVFFSVCVMKTTKFGLNICDLSSLIDNDAFCSFCDAF